MKIGEILKTENKDKLYKTQINGIDTIVKVGYDYCSDKWLTVKGVGKNNTEFPIRNLYLGVILEMEFEEYKGDIKVIRRGL